MDTTHWLPHLIELRTRLLRSIAVLVLAFLVLFFFAGPLLNEITQPLLRFLPPGSHLIAIHVVTPLLTPLRIAFYGAFFLVLPYIGFELWRFLKPGLYQHEERLVWALMLSSLILFYLGAAFNFFVILPLFFQFLTSMAPSSIQIMTDIGGYLDFILANFVIFGCAFETPVLVALLVLFKITTPSALVAARPYVIVAAFFIGMILTPPDVISQTLLAIPLWLLFEVGVWFAKRLPNEL